MKDIKPMPLWLALIYFAVPGAVLYFGCYRGVQWLHGLGLPLLVAFMIFTWVPTLSLIPVSLALYLAEGNVRSVAEFRTRFRLTRSGVRCGSGYWRPFS